MLRFYRTISYGEEHLPKDGGYVMYSNHQGRYDAVGIISVHKKPCTVVMDEVRSRLLIVNQFVELLEGVRLSRTDFRQQVECAKAIQNGVEQGRRYIYFPEGGYMYGISGRTEKTEKMELQVLCRYIKGWTKNI